jgi:hypothetical protein
MEGPRLPLPFVLAAAALARPRMGAIREIIGDQIETGKISVSTMESEGG